MANTENNTDNLINWAEVSRLLTGNRGQIRSDYNGKKYKRQITRLKNLVKLWSKLNQK